jgi:hypothetical protein
MLLKSVGRRDHFAYLGIGGRIILKWILKIRVIRVWTGSTGPVHSPVESCSEAQKAVHVFTR